MSVHHTDSYYEELYTKHKRLIDRVDNDTVEVIYYIDKKHRCRAKLDVLTGILLMGNTEVKWSKGAVI